MECPKVYDEFLGTVMDPVDRKTLEAYIGMLELGIYDDIPRFIILYGGPGSGKSVILGIITRLFEDRFASSVSFARLAKTNLIVIHDEDPDKIIKEDKKELSAEGNLKLYLKTKYIIATDKLPANRNSNVRVLCMTDERIGKNRFDKYIRPGLLKMIEAFRYYCVDSLYF